MAGVPIVGVSPAHVPVVDAVPLHVFSLRSTLVAGHAVTVAYWYGAVFALFQVHQTTFRGIAY